MFQTPSPDWLPLVPWPPPVHTCNSWPPSTGPACARTAGALRNTAKTRVVKTLRTAVSPSGSLILATWLLVLRRYRKFWRKATLFSEADMKLERRWDPRWLAPQKKEAGADTLSTLASRTEISWQRSESLLTKCCRIRPNKTRFAVSVPSVGCDVTYC